MQSDIFKYVIQSLKKSLSASDEVKFTIVDDIQTDKNENQIKFDVTDIFQTANDKTGQRIVINEQRFEPPAIYEMCIKVSCFAPKLEDALALFGFVAVFFKDHSVYECGEYNWYGNTVNKFILEPVVRRESKEKSSDSYDLDYRVEVQLNSVKGESFVRVEKKDLRSNMIK